jgi:(R,R)-butanediol dehydrogenase/meso-butanediol dehydrogenase/diacetyl reductase
VRAAVYHGRGDVRVEQVDDPRPAAGELLVRIHATGICGTDAHEYAHGPRMFPIHERNPFTGHVGPMIPGHELAGEVVALGEGVTGFAEGDLIVSGAGISDGTCWQCRRGRTNLCESYASVGLQRHGGLAQYCALPAATCVAADPYGLPRDTAALAQPMAIAVHAARRGRVRAGEDAVVVGAGGIGAFLTFAVAHTTARVLTLDLDSDRLTLARALGADLALKPSDALAEQVADEGLHPAVVYEVTGTRGGLATALGVLPPGGRLVLVGLQPGTLDEPLRDLTLLEHEVVGTNALVRAEDLPEALRLLAGRRNPWNDVAPLAVTLDRLVPDGLEPLVDGRATRVKTIIDPWATENRPTEMERAA